VPVEEAAGWPVARDLRVAEDHLGALFHGLRPSMLVEVGSFDLEFAQTSKWDGDRLIVISAFWDVALQAKQLGLPV
jgi:hypothetical protein